MIGNSGEIEAGLLGAPSIADKLGRSMLLRHQLVAEIHHQFCPRLFFLSSLCSDALYRLEARSTIWAVFWSFGVPCLRSQLG